MSDQSSLPSTAWALAGTNSSVVSAIQGAAGVVFLIGPPGSDDRWQTFEWQQVVEYEYYLDPAKPLIPVLIGKPDLPGFLKTRQALSLDDTPSTSEAVAARIVEALNDPAVSVDEQKLELGRQARRKALASFRAYSQTLGEEDVKRAGIRAID